MGKLTLKGLIGAGNALLNGQDAGQAKTGVTVDNGNGDAGERPIEVSTISVRESEVFSRDKLIALIVEHNDQPKNAIISRAWHPDSKTNDLFCEVIGSNYADVPLLVGKASYQLSTGEIVDI